MSANEPFNVSMDAKHSSGGRQVLGQLRGGMVAAAESVKLTDRFLVTQSAHTPSMIIHDTETGRSTKVSLCDYRGIRNALDELFGAPRPTAKQQLEEMGLPLMAEIDGLKAIGGNSPTEDEPAYTLEIEGVDAGELGVGRIQLRGREFHLIGTAGWSGQYDDFADAMDAAVDEILPLYRQPSYR